MESALPPSVWDEALGGVEKDVVQFATGYLRHGPVWGEGGPPPGPHVEWQRGHDAPPCPRCQTTMRLAPQGGCVCPACGAGRAILPKPPWLPENSPVLGFVSDEPAVAEERPREPVHVACTQCGGPLVADGSSRIVPCGYCSARVALPDAVWAALHPPRIKKRWWLVIHVAADPRREPANLMRFQTPAVTIGGGLGVLGALGFFVVAPGAFERIELAIAGCFVVPAAIFLCLWLRMRLRYWHICRPENEVVGRLSTHWSSGFGTKVLITRANQPAIVLARASLWALDRKRFDELGGEGGKVRAWMVPGNPRLTYVAPMPSLLE
ncbi:hypothetical protein WMF11_14120 [Sorangium sp. So ce295]|uniref:hypothetical protein n=1 Tax=Sorangium sp. So ce295 TaxID=3133295 RepID=UPI003F61AACD